MDKKTSKKKQKSKSKEKSKSKSKEKSKEKKTNKSITKKSKKITNTSVKKSSEKKKVQSKGKKKGKSKSKKVKKNISNKKPVEEIVIEENNSDTIMITQKLDGNMFVKNKKEKNEKKEKKVVKTFSEIKIGTPHYDIIPHIKEMIVEKEKSINKLNTDKQNFIENIRSIYNKLDGMESLLYETPEQKDKIAMLYLILNLNKKNHINSTNIKNKFKNEYNDLLLKNRYNPIEKLNEFGIKINISKNENFEITKEIEKLKNINIASKFQIKNKTKKDKNIFEINYLINELNSLNNQKHEALIKLKNSKKIIKSSITRFENLLKIYDENKIKDQYMNKVDKDINILKEDLLIKNEEEFYNKIYNGQSLVFNNNIHVLKLKISRNNLNSTEQLFSAKRNKILRKNKSIELYKINSNFLNESKDNNNVDNNNIILKKKMFKRNILPKIKNYNEANNKSVLIEKNEIQLNKSINYDELNESKINEINIHEINFKKEYYNIIDKKLENSIKDIENMYKRKIKNVEDLLNSNKEKYFDLKKRNDLLRIEIDNLHKIIRLQVKQFIELTEKKNISIDFGVSKITNIESN
jgi:hypothetical protein